MHSRSRHEIFDAIEGATERIRAYRIERKIDLLTREIEELLMTVLQPPPGTQVQPIKSTEVEVIKPEEVGTIDQGLTVIKPAPAAKPAQQPLQKVQIRGMSNVASAIRYRLESVRRNMGGLTDDLASLDKTIADMRGHVNATHEDIHSDATMLGNSAGNGGESSQELADKLTGDT